MEDPETHCPHASPDGGGVCTGDIETPDPDPKPDPKGACTNEADQEIVDTTDVEAISYDCALKNLGNAKAATECIQEETGLSDACVGCFGQVNACGMSKCLAQCIQPQSKACTECIDENCMPAFEECSGLSAE